MVEEPWNIVKLYFPKFKVGGWPQANVNQVLNLGLRGIEANRDSGDCQCLNAIDEEGGMKMNENSR